MVHENFPIVVRCVLVVLSAIAFAVGGAGRLKSCTFGETHYNSQNQINFLIATGVLVFIIMTLRVILFDYKKRRLPSMKVQVTVDGVLLSLTLLSSIAAALSPIANDVCTGDNDMRVFIQEVCEFSCSNIVVSIVTTFIMCVAFVVLLLCTTGVIPVGSSADPVEDFTCGETGTPRARKINQQGSPTKTSITGQV